MQSHWFWASSWATSRPGCANLGSRVLIYTGLCLSKLLSVAMEHSAVATAMECFHSCLAIIFFHKIVKTSQEEIRHDLIHTQQPIRISLNPSWENINSFPDLQRCLWLHPCPFTQWPPGLRLSCVGKFPTSDCSILVDLPQVNKPPWSLRKPSPAPFIFFYSC